MNKYEVTRRLDMGDDPLELSIEKWKDILDGTGTDEETNNCALCITHSTTCHSCPVYKKTKLSGCNGSPFSVWHNHKRLCDKGTTTCSECRRIAQDELKFLKSLRPAKEEKEENDE